MEILFLNLWGRIANGILAYQTIDQIFEVDFKKTRLETQSRIENSTVQEL